MRIVGAGQSRQKRDAQPGKTGKYIRWITGLVAVAVICTLMLPSFIHIMGRIAYSSAMINMPEGGLQVLEHRFVPDIVPYPNDSSSDPLPPEESSPGPSLPEEYSHPDIGDAPDIPTEYQGRVIEQMLGALAPSSSTFQFGEAYVRNYTELSKDTVAEVLERPFSLRLDITDEPQILIVHTHATESFEMYDRDIYDIRNNWRSVDNNINMVRVGDELARVLEEEGFSVIHDTTQHDYPSYNGSYNRSAETINSYLEQYPSIKIVLDLHRDGLAGADNTITKPVTVIDGRKAAQLMIIAPCEDGTMNIPQWRENFRFATELTSYIEEDYPTLNRPIFFCYRKYNMDLSTGSLLLEFGANGNTLDEAIYTAELVGRSMARYLRDITE